MTPLDRLVKERNASIEPNVSSINFSTSIDSNIINVAIGEVKIQCLLDTGASISCVSQSLLNRIKQSQTLNVTKSTYNQVYGVEGEILNIIGCVTLTFTIADREFKQEFHIFKRLHHSIILGVDWLQNNKCKIDYSSNALTSRAGTPLISFCSAPEFNFNL